MADGSTDPRAATLSGLRRLLERVETKAREPQSFARRQRDAADIASLRDAIHHLGADAHLEKARALQRTADPTANALIEAMLPQLLIVLTQRLGGDITVPVDEIDATGRLNLAMAVAGRTFRFVVTRKA